MAELLSEYVLRRFDPTGTMFFAYDNPDTEDVDKETQRYVSLVNAGLLTGNEARSALGIEQGGEELDVYRFNGNPIVAPAKENVDVTLDAPTSESEDQGEEDATSEGEVEASEQREATDAGRDGVAEKAAVPDRKAGTHAAVQLNCTCASCKSGEAIRPDGMNDAIREMASDLNRWYMQTYLRGIGPTGLVIDMQASRALDDILTEGLDRMFRQGLEATVSVADSRSTPTQASERARTYLNETKLNLVTTIQETAKERAAQIIADGIEQGKTIDEIRDGLGESGVTDAMAERVARTETARAYQFGELEGASTTGAFAGRQWALAGGPCALCSAISTMLGGKAVPYDQPFLPAGTTIATSEGSVTYTTPVWVPSEAHPNCRCATIDVLKEGE
jgi:hypothetical protein